MQQRKEHRARLPTNVNLALVAGAQVTACAGASGALDPGDKHRDDTLWEWPAYRLARTTSTWIGCAPCTVNSRWKARPAFLAVAM